VDLSRFIEDEAAKPKPGRKVAHWILLVAMIAFVIQILAGFYWMKNGGQLAGIRMIIGGSFFFLISYAANWLIRN
jgi:hypothetical protein